MDTEWSDILLLNFLHTATELMENLKEREQLLSLLCHTINGFTDDLDGEKTTQMTGETVSKLCKKISCWIVKTVNHTMMQLRFVSSPTHLSHSMDRCESV